LSTGGMSVAITEATKQSSNRIEGQKQETEATKEKVAYIQNHGATKDWNLTITLMIPRANMSERRSDFHTGSQDDLRRALARM